MAFNETIIAAVTAFSGTTTPDKNGQNPVMLQCIAGKMPNRNVLSGTVALRNGFEVGKTYLINVRETGYDEIFGSDFNFIKVMELKSALDIVQTGKELGAPTIMFVPRPEAFEEHYQRKGDAVESNRTRRIREGVYHPSVQTNISSHETAREVVKGTSVGSGGTVINADEYLSYLRSQKVEIPGEGDFTPHDLPADFYDEGEEEKQRQQDQARDQEGEEGDNEEEQGGEQTPPVNPRPTRRR